MTEPLTTTPSHRPTISQPFPLQTLSTPITCTNSYLTLADTQAILMVVSFHKMGYYKSEVLKSFVFIIKNSENCCQNI